MITSREVEVALVTLANEEPMRTVFREGMVLKPEP